LEKENIAVRYISLNGGELWSGNMGMERKGMERIHERFLRWILEMNERTPGYMVREELQREKLRSRAGKRVLDEERLREEGGSMWAQWCLKDMRERALRGGELSVWEREREQFYVERGMGIKIWEMQRMEGENKRDLLIKKDREDQKRIRWERINESRYNKWYGEIKGKGFPKYLLREWGESRWKRVVRFRLENEIKESRY